MAKLEEIVNGENTPAEVKDFAQELIDVREAISTPASEAVAKLVKMQAVHGLSAAEMVQAVTPMFQLIQDAYNATENAIAPVVSKLIPPPAPEPVVVAPAPTPAPAVVTPPEVAVVPAAPVVTPVAPINA